MPCVVACFFVRIISSFAKYEMLFRVDDQTRALDSLLDASREAFMSEAREVFGHTPPKRLSRYLIIQVLNYTYQLDTMGRYTKHHDRRFKITAPRDVVRAAPKT